MSNKTILDKKDLTAVAHILTSCTRSPT